MGQRQQILLSSCAIASTAHETSFRIDFNDFEPRAARVIALDDAAADVVTRLAAEAWGGGRFLVFGELGEEDPNGQRDAVLRTVDGQPRGLIEELEDSDVVVMIATAEADAQAAGVVGDAAAARPVMSAALVLAKDDAEVEDAVAALRPNAMVMLVLHEESDIREVLTALRV